MKKLLRALLELIVMLFFALAIPLVIKQFVLRPIRFNFMQNSPLGQTIQWGVSTVLILGGYSLAVRLSEKRPVYELNIWKALPHLGLGMLWGFLSIGGIAALLGLTGVFQLTGRGDPAGHWRLLLILFLLAMTEEIIYRGILHRLIEKWTNTAVALVVSSLLFSLMHFSNDHYSLASFLAILSGGAVMGLLYSMTGSLWLPMACHYSWNLCQVLLGIRLSGMDDFAGLALLRSELNGPTLWTGGSFGLENSALTIGYTIILSVILSFTLFTAKSKIRSLEHYRNTPSAEKQSILK